MCGHFNARVEARVVAASVVVVMVELGAGVETDTDTHITLFPRGIGVER